MHKMTSELLIPFVQSLPGCETQPGLYIVATPIGHLSDISLRALAILSQADLIACEDTRVTFKLLSLYNIKKPLLPYHDHNAEQASKKIIHHIKQGQCVALVSDAGTPLISDPGFNVVSECIKNNMYITSIPGPSAAITALTISGLPSDRFVFLGFLPAKSAARQKELSAYKTYKETLILYEAPHRITALLEDLLSTLGDRYIVLCRELTKRFEEIHRGLISNLLNTFSDTDPKGEFVVLIEAATATTLNEITDKEILDLINHLSSKDAAEYLSKIHGVSKKDLYQRIIQLKK
jgi:16S rRNA (cytidine1402-2'-O)-methyltransferase